MRIYQQTRYQPRTGKSLFLLLVRNESLIKSFVAIWPGAGLWSAGIEGDQIFIHQYWCGKISIIRWHWWILEIRIPVFYGSWTSCFTHVPLNLLFSPHQNNVQHLEASKVFQLINHNNKSDTCKPIIISKANYSPSYPILFCLPYYL